MTTGTETNPRRPILLTVGLLMAAIVLLAVTDMLSSMFIAQVNQGMAAAVNQSGTLRMQSYRIGVALADTGSTMQERRRRVAELGAEFERRLKSPRLADAVPAAGGDPVRLAYERVRWRWSHEMRHALDAFLSGADPEQARRAYLGLVDNFVDDIHGLVQVLEERAEHRTDLLRAIQAIALVLTVGVVLITLWWVQRRVVTPLGELLDCADHARQGDFSRQTRFVGGDELGRLGTAMNLMTEGLSQIYNELEERVAEKTRDLARTNHSLELLYRISRALEESPVSEQVLRQVLGDVRAELRLAEVTLCLRDGHGPPGTDCIGTGSATKPAQGCRQIDCSFCHGPLSTAESAVGAGVISLPVGDQGGRLGTLRVASRPQRPLEPWQLPLLESLTGHLTTALKLQDRMREGRRLVLHEERSILARELHDSLAQSLSYLKIQAARLDAALQAETGGDPDAPARILAEIRAGISSAYRQLRELLTTFRLKIDGQGLGNALAETAQEFRTRGAFDVVLDDRLPPGLLSPNEEVHVLQVVREALSNVARHARARCCRIELALADGEVAVLVADDGVGIQPGAQGHGHYGMTIMRERAFSLGGCIEIETPANTRGHTGTELRLRFTPRSLAKHGVDGTHLADANRPAEAAPGDP
jgi:two-component system nitrate/nitrite sensor histidine kinase NarX